jgi:putative two-component system response regulator
MTELLIVDDDQTLRHWTERVVQERGYSCDGVGDVAEARDNLQRSVYQLVLLSVNMPSTSGMELLAHIRSSHPAMAVVMVTGEDDPRLALTAIEHGAYGYMVKPVGPGELMINVANALHRRRHVQESRRVVQRTQATADHRSRALQEALEELQGPANAGGWASQAETIFRLARLVEFRDEESGHHLQRMSCYCEILARRIGLSEPHSELVRLAGQLHDVGKVATPDSLLRKHGKLTAQEFEVVKEHAVTGYKMLAGSSSEVVRLGASIAHCHHERWDGGGYPRGLVGSEIPREARIAAIADVFDALTSDRVYRAAFPVQSAFELLQAGRGSHFDPDMLDAFVAARDEIEAIRHTYTD